jgi:hypothetical protein
MATLTDYDMLGSKWTTDEKGRSIRSSYRIANVLAAKKRENEIIVKRRRKPKKKNAELQKVSKMGLLQQLIHQKIIEVRQIVNLPPLPNYILGSTWGTDNQGRNVRSSPRIAHILEVKKLTNIVENDICKFGIRVR